MSNRYPAGHPLSVALASAFGLEWATLDPHDKDLILRDVTEDGGVDDFRSYARNIGRGNLASYALTQRVRFRSFPETERDVITEQR